MKLETKLRHNGEVAILDLSGRITLGEEAESLRQTLIDIFEQGHRRIVLNLEKVTHIDSAGLGDLVAGYAAIAPQGGVIRLAAAQKKFAEVMRQTGLDSLFEICPNEDSAVSTFTADTVARNLAALDRFKA